MHQFTHQVFILRLELLASICPPGYQYISYSNGGKCYMFGYSYKLPQSQAAAACNNGLVTGAYLARIDSFSEQMAIGKFINDTLDSLLLFYFALFAQFTGANIEMIQKFSSSFVTVSVFDEPT
jgi:hypothetical protein